MITGLKQKLDYDDYARISPDGKRYELLEGNLCVTPAPSPLHQRVSRRSWIRRPRASNATGGRPMRMSWSPRGRAISP